jgi:hypothetical protein
MQSRNNSKRIRADRPKRSLYVYKLISCMSQSVKDFFAGLCSGWAQVIIMQPFDIIKIRLQTQNLANPRYHGIVDCFKKIVSEEGPLALYKGTL